MPSPRFTQSTAFSEDVLGRYVCNGFYEATLSADPNPGPDLGRPFPRSPIDISILGVGIFGPALAQRLFENDGTSIHRILVLEGGPFTVPSRSYRRDAIVPMAPM